MKRWKQPWWNHDDNNRCHTLCSLLHCLHFCLILWCCVYVLCAQTHHFYVITFLMLYTFFMTGCEYCAYSEKRELSVSIDTGHCPIHRYFILITVYYISLRHTIAYQAKRSLGFLSNWMQMLHFFVPRWKVDLFVEAVGPLTEILGLAYRQLQQTKIEGHGGAYVK
jgi:hypothetical protein